jgi:hypothetical protein
MPTERPFVNQVERFSPQSRIACDNSVFRCAAWVPGEFPDGYSAAHRDRVASDRDGANR